MNKARTNGGFVERNLFYLRSKAWYRLLKVLFVVFLLISLAIYNLIIQHDNQFKDIDIKKSEIICHRGVHSYVDAQDTYHFTNRKGMYFDEIGIGTSDISEYLYGGIFDYERYFREQNPSDILKVIEKCDQQTARYRTIIPSFDVEKLRANGHNNHEIIKYLITAFANERLLDFNIVHKLSIKYLIIGNLIILALFELLRRIFYYVVLGTFVPRKKA
jgi:hypothetical protein